MWQNILTLSFRLMAKQRLFFLINLIGLTVGLMAVIMIVSYVRDQLSYDQWVPDADRIVRIGYTSPRDTGAPFVSSTAPGIVAPTLNTALSDKLVAARFINSSERFQVGDRYFDTRTIRTQPEFFDVYAVDALFGDPKTAIEDPNSVVLTESEAIKYFGQANVLGETVTLAGVRDFRVGAVIQDWPEKSHMVHAIFRKQVESEFNGASWMFNSWTAATHWTYAKLKPGYSVDDLDADLSGFIERNVSRSESALPTLTTLNLTDIYTDGRTDIIATLLVVAAFILLIAGLNFVNLTLSRLIVREKEVAIRRVVGANKTQVVLQFLAESCLITLIALTVALALTEVTLPLFNETMGTAIEISLFGDPVLALLSLGLVLAVGIGAGLVPALTMAKGLPAAGLAKGQEKAGSLPAKIGPALVLVQFSLAIGLITATWVVYSQTIFALTQDPGYSVENKIAVYTGAELSDQLRTAFGQMDGVTSVVSSFTLPGRGGEISATLTKSGGEKIPEIIHMAADAGFMAAYKVTPLAGRLPTPDRSTDVYQGNLPEGVVRAPQSVVINDQARRALGFETPEAAVNQIVTSNISNDEELPLTIIGVIPDIKLRSVRLATRALLFTDIPQLNQFLTISYEGRSSKDMREEISALWNEVVPTETLWAQELEDVLARFYEEDRRQSVLFGVSSVFAVFIACLGLYGLSGFTAERRTKEIGIRKVLGAQIIDIVRLFVWQFSKPVLLANAIAWPLAWWFLQDWLSQFVDRIDLTPYPFIAAGAAAIFIAGATVAGQAVRVARANPIRALKYE